MFKTLILTGLLAFSTSVNALNNENNVNISNSDCDSVSSVPINRELDPNLNKRFSFYGFYNYRDSISFDFNDIGVYPGDIVGTYVIWFADSTVAYHSALSSSVKLQRLASITFDVTYGDGDTYVMPSYYFIDYNNPSGTTTIDESNVFISSFPLSDFDYTDFVFYVAEPIILQGVSGYLFDAFFTHDDNAVITSYSGYYSFNANVTSISSFAVVGSVALDQTLYLGVYGYADSLFFPYYDTELNDYLYQSTLEIQSKQLFFSTCKMPISTKNYLQTKGVFGYVHDSTYDDSDFHDLLFTIMDSPIYFLTSLFNFELFGVNLFIAFTSLLTLLVAIVLIRKFW